MKKIEKKNMQTFKIIFLLFNHEITSLIKLFSFYGPVKVYVHANLKTVSVTT